jgi:glutamyl/glutaminyl-tRNA synthetase
MNTVFNPTTNGELHLGHLYMILVNECEAHRSGGKFIIRFDDNQFKWNVVEHVNFSFRPIIVNSMIWLDIKVDKYTSQLETEVDVDKMLYYMNKGPIPVVEMKTNTVQIPHMINPMNHDPYPYVPWITARKVVEDFLDEISLKIRGDDLISEYALYSYFCDLWQLPQPVQWFLPRLFTESGNKLSNVSKTSGNWKLSSFYERGIRPQDLIENLKNYCLKDSKGEWTLDNVEPYPVIPEDFLK